MSRRIAVLAALALFLALLSGCGAKSVAVVNGTKISQERFDRFFEQFKTRAQQMGTSFDGEQGKQALDKLKQETLDSLIDEALVLQAAEKEGISVSQEEIAQFLEKQVKSSFKTDKEYQDWLTSLKMTEEECKDRIKYQISGQKLFEKLTQKVNVTDEMVEKYYEQDQASWEKIKVSHILIAAERDKVSQTELDQAKAKALGVIKELDQGADFAELARKYSQDPGTAAQGGVLDMEFSRNDQGLVPEFVAGAFKLTKVGEYSKEPVLSQFGYHIIKLDAQKGSFADVKPDVKNQLLQTEKNKAFAQYMDGVKKAASITRNLK